MKVHTDMKKKETLIMQGVLANMNPAKYAAGEIQLGMPNKQSYLGSLESIAGFPEYQQQVDSTILAPTNKGMKTKMQKARDKLEEQMDGAKEAATRFGLQEKMKIHIGQAKETLKRLNTTLAEVALVHLIKTVSTRSAKAMETAVEQEITKMGRRGISLMDLHTSVSSEIQKYREA